VASLERDLAALTKELDRAARGYHAAIDSAVLSIAVTALRRAEHLFDAGTVTPGHHAALVARLRTRIEKLPRAGKRAHLCKGAGCEHHGAARGMRAGRRNAAGGDVGSARLARSQARIAVFESLDRRDRLLPRVSSIRPISRAGFAVTLDARRGAIARSMAFDGMHQTADAFRLMTRTKTRRVMTRSAFSSLRDIPHAQIAQREQAIL
jgi:hypothetical protein